MVKEYTIVKADQGWKVAQYVTSGCEEPWIAYTPIIAFKIEHSIMHRNIPITIDGSMEIRGNQWAYVTPDGNFWSDEEGGPITSEKEMLECFNRWEKIAAQIRTNGQHGSQLTPHQTSSSSSPDGAGMT